MNPTLDQLEDRIHALIAKLKQLHSDNERLRDELSLSRQDFEQQSRQLEEVLQKHNDIALLAATQPKQNDELNSKIQFQEQQLQLLEKERLNLRDQIAFLQNTIQNKEKEWQEKIQQNQDDWNEKEQQWQHSQDEQQQRLLSLKQQFQEAEHRAGSLQHEYDLFKAQNDIQQKNHQKQLDELTDKHNSQVNELTQLHQQQLDELNQQLTQQQQQLDDNQAQLNQKQNQIDELQTQVQAAQAELSEESTQHAQNLQKQQEEAEQRYNAETERLNNALSEQQQQHEQSITQLTQEMATRQARLHEEKAQLQEQILKLNSQNQEYRSLLLQSARDIRALLARLPVSESDDTQGEDE